MIIKNSTVLLALAAAASSSSSSMLTTTAFQPRPVLRLRRQGMQMQMSSGNGISSISKSGSTNSNIINNSKLPSFTLATTAVASSVPRAGTTRLQTATTVDNEIVLMEESALAPVTETATLMPEQTVVARLHHAVPVGATLAPSAVIATTTTTKQHQIPPPTTISTSSSSSSSSLLPSASVIAPSNRLDSGIALSGLKGQAMGWDHTDFPKSGEIRAVIPTDCFEPNTATSLQYLSISLIGTAACSAIGWAASSILPPDAIWTWPIFWIPYAAVTGTVAMGLWVLAHECGHGAFSKNKALQDAIGYVLHSLMLVPYFSWQRSHAVHHQYTNHMELGETHVPEPMTSGSSNELEGSMAARAMIIKTLGPQWGLRTWGALQLFLHLTVGWPAYLLIGATGGAARGMTNHFYPNPLTTPDQPKKELFPGQWKEKVYASDIGVAAVLGAVVAWAYCNGLAEVTALYGAPLLVINAWLVTYTWLQHTDVDVPHFSSDNHTFVKGALHTIDRPYDRMDPFGLIDFLHHRIGTTHVAHHFDSSIPHYKAEVASRAIQKSFPHLYMHDPTPIAQALWRVAKGCTAVERQGDHME